MAGNSATKAFRNWMYSTSYEDIPPDVRKKALLAVYDTIGGILASSMIPISHRIVDFVKVVGGPPDCSIMGFPMRTSVLNAAIVNGTMGHADEVDPVERGRGGTGGINFAPPMAAALAAGQLTGASGQEVLRALVLSYELTKRINLVGARAEDEAGRPFGPVDAGHSIGSTAAAGIALGLPPDRMEVALGLAANMASGVSAFVGEPEHMAKSFQRGGMGARNGVTAALMAKTGFDGPRDIFDGRFGFFFGRLGVEDPGPEFIQGLGENYAIMGMMFKSQSAGGPNQAPRQALLEMMSDHSLTADDISEIRVELDPVGFNTITNIHYPSLYGRDVLAMAALYGGMGFREAHDESYYNSPEVRSMRERVSFSPRTDWTGDEDHSHAFVTILAKDGRELRKETTYRTMTDEDLDAKFSYLVGLRAGEAKAKELAHVLKRLDNVRNVAEVMTQLELPAAFL